MPRIGAQAGAKDHATQRRPACIQSVARRAYCRRETACGIDETGTISSIVRKRWRVHRPPRPWTCLDRNRLMPAEGYSLAELDDAGLSIEQAEYLGLPVDAGRVGSYGPNVTTLREYIAPPARVSNPNARLSRVSLATFRGPITHNRSLRLSCLCWRPRFLRSRLCAHQQNCKFGCSSPPKPLTYWLLSLKERPIVKKKIRVAQFGVGPIGASIVRLMRQKAFARNRRRDRQRPRQSRPRSRRSQSAPQTLPGASLSPPELRTSSRSPWTWSSTPPRPTSASVMDRASRVPLRRLLHRFHLRRARLSVPQASRAFRPARRRRKRRRRRAGRHRRQSRLRDGQARPHPQRRRAAR